MMAKRLELATVDRAISALRRAAGILDGMADKHRAEGRRGHPSHVGVADMLAAEAKALTAAADELTKGAGYAH